MVFTRLQLSELSHEDLLEYAVKQSDLCEKLESLESKITQLLNVNADLEKRISTVESSLSVSRKCNDLLTGKVKALEIQALNNSQYARRFQIEVHNVSEAIKPVELTSRICDILSLTGQDVTLIV